MENKLTEQQAIEARRKYVCAFNATMVQMWKEQITLLGVIDTGALLHSTVGIATSFDGRITQVTLSQGFAQHGLWQEYGTGRETPRGNTGDIGHDKVRKARPWFSRKYFSSFMNIRDFMADSLGQEFLGAITDAINRNP